MTTVRDLREWKRQGRRFAMLTCYDFPTAQILDEAGIPLLLVGDSVADNILGYENTLPVTMDEMLHHCKAVARGARNAMIVGDSSIDILTGRNAGIASCGVTYGFAPHTLCEVPPDVVVENPRELTELFT